MTFRHPAEAVRPSASSSPPSIEFQRQWQIGQQPQIKSFLSQQAALPLSELAAVAQIDLLERWRRGEKAGTSHYLTLFPQFLADTTLVVDLLYTEFLVREELGERSHLTQLQQQFPQYAAELAAQIEFRCALEDSAGENGELGTSEDRPENTVETEQPHETFGPRSKPQTRLPSLGPGYEVLAEIGRGGMGVVYRARQVGLNRLVALKMVRGAEYASAELLARFRAEAEVVARLHHPNIVQIFDYGEYDGLPYLALELVQGQTLAARLGAQPWPDRHAAALVASLAVAVQFAHERGVIHRDLKPANILLESRKAERESSPSEQRTGSSWPQNQIAKITDFGLAKVFRDNDDAQSHTGSVLGTPSYMAPEQASGKGELIGPQTDVYGLGAILYELLAGQPAFRGPTAIVTLQQVLNAHAVALRRLNPRVSRDLVTICDKCLSKEPGRRYPTAGALASDLERFLNDRPIQACRTSALERGWRWCRRNPALATLGTVVGMLLMVVATVSSISSVRLSSELKQRKEAQTAERDAKQTAQLRLWDAYLAEVRARTASRQLGHRFAALETVERATELLGQIGRTPDRERQLRNAAIAALALPDLRQLRQIKGEVPTGLASCALLADRYVCTFSSGDLSVRDFAGCELLRVKHRGVPVPVISRNGRYLGASDSRGLKVWRINETDKSVEAEVVWEEAGASYLSLAPDCQHAAYLGANGAMHWIDLDSGKVVRRLGRGPARSSFRFHEPSRRIAVVGDKGVQIISWETGEVLAEPPLPVGSFADIAWHPAGEHIAVSNVEDGVVLWHVVSGKKVLAYPHFGVIKLFFVGRGDYLLTHNIWDFHLSLWQTGTGHQVLSDPTFSNFDLEQTPEGRNLLFVKDTAEVSIWEVETATVCSTLPHSIHSALGGRISAAIGERGRLLMLGGGHGLELWDLEREELADRLESGLAFATFIDDGSIVARHESGIWLWSRNESASEIVFGPPRQLFGATTEPKFAISPDGKLLAAYTKDGWRLAGATATERTLATAPQFDPRTAAITPDAKWVALGSWNGYGVSIFSPHAGEHVAQVSTGPYAIPIFSPDNRLLATSPDGVKVWSTVDWQPVAEVRARGNTASDLGIAFSPDSRVLAVSEPTGTTRLVDPSTGLDWAVLAHPDQHAGCFVRFSQDQRRIVTTSTYERQAVRSWDLSLIRQELSRLGLDWPAEVLQASPASAKTGTLKVSFDRGTQWPKQEAATMLVQAQALRATARRDSLARAIQVDPDNTSACNELAWLLATGPIELRDPQGALANARQAVTLEEDNSNYLNTLGIALCRNANYDEGIQVLERSLALRADDTAYDLLFLAWAHAGKGDTKIAHEYYTKAKVQYDTRGQSKSKTWRDEFSRLVDEMRVAIMP